MSNEVTISKEAYALLVKEAHDAECLKSVIAKKRDGYSAISHEEIKLLYTLYFEESEGAE